MGWHLRQTLAPTSSKFFILSIIISIAVASEQTIGHLSSSYSAPDNNQSYQDATENLALSDSRDENAYESKEKDGAALEDEAVARGDVVRAKRGGNNWSNLRGSWGKRDTPTPSQGWNSFRGAWGKKADWSSLRGSWGKRSRDVESAKRADWSNFRGSWGKREDRADDPTESSESDLAKRARWSNLQGSWGKRNDGEGDAVAPNRLWEGDQLEQDYDSDDEELLDSTLTEPLRPREELLFETMKLLSERGKNKEPAGEEVLDSDQKEIRYSVNKRSSSQAAPWLKRPEGGLLLVPRSVNWSSLRGSWGKRSGASKWNKLRGVWGKRPEKVTSWNDLRGTWGKRPNQAASWANLRGTWGKRPNQAPSWTNLRGTWGKRPDQAASWANLRGAWGKKSGGNWASLRGTWGKRGDLDLNGLIGGGEEEAE